MGGNDRSPAGGASGSAHRPDGDDAGALARGSEERGYALDWLALDKTPFVFLSDGLGIVWSNAAATAELEKRRDLEVRGGALAMTDRGQQPQLERFLASLNGGVWTWSVPRSDGDGHLLFRAQRLSEAPWRCGVRFYGSGADFHAEYADLLPIFGLTPAENNVLLGLLEGLDAQRIADRDTVSIETTRSHIRAIYLKLDVNSREGLFHRVRPYRL
ncbi:MAG: LuxR C-terminal-related transcriptional regulator [Allosphingosinicella sp.]